MKIVIRDAKYLAAVRPLDMAGYLRARGWTLLRYRQQIAQTWVKGDAYEVVLPLDRQIDGFAARMSELLRTLSTAEQTDQQALMNDIRDGSADTIRISADGGDSDDGTINVVDGDNLLNAARGIVLAAACSAVRPRAYFAHRRPTQANEFIRRVRLAQSEVGSYRVRLLTPIPPVTPAAQGSFSGLTITDQQPFERVTTETLTSGLQAVSQAAEGVFELRDNAGVDGLISRGVNGNLCDSLSQLRTLTRAATSIHISVSWSWRRPARATSPVAFTFAADHLEAVGELGRVLKEFVPQEEIELLGTVVKLERDIAATEGVAVVRAYFDEGVRLVRIRLRDDTYSLATAAHESRALVACFGDLVRQGRQYELRYPRAFRIVPVTVDGEQPPIEGAGPY